jgi:hypothetical protein
MRPRVPARRVKGILSLVKRTLSSACFCALAVVAVVVGMTSAEATRARGPFVTSGCPSRDDYGGGTAQEAAAAALRYYIRKDPLIHVQGRTVKRTAANTPAVEIVALGLTGEALPGAALLKKQAMQRCRSHATARSAFWAVVFHEGVSVICCLHSTFFVGQRKPHHWFAFGVSNSVG